MTTPSQFSFVDKKILVVDDQRPFQIMMRGLLKSMQAGLVEVASSGEKAIQKCNETKFDIAFIDYNLGSGRNGRQLHQELRERELLPLHAISLLVTGESQSTMVIGAIEAEPDDYIIKPFSQHLIKQRVAKAWAQKQAFLPAIVAKHNLHNLKAVGVLDDIANTHPRYANSAAKLKAELLLELKQFSELDDFIQPLLDNKRPTWVLLIKAKSYQLQDKLHKAIKFAKEAILQGKFNLIGYDIITDCYLKLNDVTQAYNWVKQAIEMSPYSVTRQYQLSFVAKLNKDFETSVKACSDVVDMTSYAFKKDYRHIVNHIRNIIDICRQEQDELKKKKYNQEAVYALHKSKHQASSFINFSQMDFEVLCQAQLDSIDGYNLKAKKQFSKLMGKYEVDKEPFPTELLTDGLTLMLKIGEYDKAQEFSHQLQKNTDKLDNFSRRLISQSQHQAKDSIQQVKLFNKEGIEAFTNNDVTKAMSMFENALKIAPMHTGSALNLIQAILAKMAVEQNNWSFIEKCQQVFRIVEGMPLSTGHQKRYTELKEKFESLSRYKK